MNFKNYPVGIREAKAKSIGDWTPREALLAALRDIDAGRYKDVSSLVVAVAHKEDDGKVTFGFSVATSNRLEMIGLLNQITTFYTEDKG